MRQAIGWSCGIALLTIIGCAVTSRNPSTPSGQAPTPSPTDTTALGPTLQSGHVLEGTVAKYAFRIDPGSWTATSTLVEQRAAAANDDLYQLPIGGFLRNDSLRIDRIQADADSLYLTYTFEHPFSAPSNLDAPATAKNRIDLGITGKILFLLDSLDPTGDTFFDETGSGGGRVIANTHVVTNADGYFSPEALVPNTLAANTFPYKTLVDESLDSRVATSDGLPRTNGGSALGNFDLTTGWTRATVGPNRDGWTGMGFLHHGQRVTTTIALNKAALAAQNFSFDAAIIAKYVDPRGGEITAQKRANRLPATTPDLAQFVYRAPHASQDVESIRFAGESGGFLPNVISASILNFHVVDWDAKAFETDQVDLAADSSSASKVAQGTSGAPALAVCIPGVLGPASVITELGAGALVNDDSVYGGDPDEDSGRPGDALFFSAIVTKGPVGSQAEGIYTGMVRATDVEANLPTPQILNLDGSLSPLTTGIPKPVTYQAFQVLLDDYNDIPTLTMNVPADVDSGTTTSITVTAANDLNGDPITVQIDWDNDGIHEATHTINPPYTTPITWNSTVPKYNNTTLLPLTRSIPVRFTDGVMASPQNYGPLQFMLGPNQAPQVSGAPALAAATLISPATFQLLAGSATITDPEGDPVTLKVVNDVDANIVTGAAFPIGGLGPYTNPPTSNVSFTVYATDLLHPDTGAGPSNGSAFAPVSGTINVPCTPNINQHTWTFTSGNDGWTSGHLFTPQVFNSDNAPGNSRFYRCSSKASQGAGFSGGCITTGPHAVGACGTNDNDYGAQCDNSMISPTISLVGKTDAVLVFNSSKNGRNGSTPRYRVWVSTDNGANWLSSNIIYDTEKTASGMVNENNVTVSLAAYTGMANLRLRFQFIDTTNSSFSVATSQFAGWSCDNIRINSCP
ncbi:MAG: hypothetical protein GEEBNDBF_02408 [bacterium]|nr:hypothetical protein [bacterium]